LAIFCTLLWVLWGWIWGSFRERIEAEKGPILGPRELLRQPVGVGFCR
jgi:hypothetical protein